MKTCVIITTSDISKTLYIKRYTKQHSTMTQSKVSQKKVKQVNEREREKFYTRLIIIVLILFPHKIKIYINRMCNILSTW